MLRGGGTKVWGAGWQCVEGGVIKVLLPGWAGLGYGLS